MSAEEAVCCPFCLSTDPNKVGVEQATGKVCRDPFHCPIPESHSDQPGGVFRYCQYCDYRENPLEEPPANWAVGWVHFADEWTGMCRCGQGPFTEAEFAEHVRNALDPSP